MRKTTPLYILKRIEHTSNIRLPCYKKRSLDIYTRLRYQDFQVL
uniref:Uncharacterized protein n=1 Tax=Candidatus Kentrum sp. TUN TaxID=2126343 RepID=A0A450ZBB6_9GAMM|nr:MAG: hypothetical protein BECKTUN1418D_GA0071000_100512 [Candidatus Kentron sp. TUN]VFK52508.1 MAG: hypothetical protein BECKTUN1418F_GA0071002_100911 [Candidatus Kentron sp. TUN]VFK52829.1 MAG: hypothetical protein BECKTUN1418E_GA0071001_101011 [Candidatus Kentron sp. TUN]